jgi:hypothetical protein
VQLQSWRICSASTPHDPKLALRWFGPCCVTQVLSDFIYLLADLLTGKCQDIHARRIGLFRISNFDSPRMSSTTCPIMLGNCMQFISFSASGNGTALSRPRHAGVGTTLGKTLGKTLWKASGKEETSKNRQLTPLSCQFPSMDVVHEPVDTTNVTYVPPATTSIKHM